MMKNVKMFCGVPLARVIKQGKFWHVQTREEETSNIWTTVSEPFSTLDQALDAAPIICEF